MCEQCLDAAVSVVTNFVETLAPSGYMQFAPDGASLWNGVLRDG